MHSALRPHPHAPHQHRCGLLMGLAALLTLTSACAWTTPPRQDDAVLTTRVKRPLSRANVARLQLMQQGVWALVDTTPERTMTRELREGQLVSAIPVRDTDGDTETARGHLFTVVLHRSWGVLLQRLDARAFDADQELYIMPLSGHNPTRAARLGYCVGQGDPRKHHCVTSARPGTRHALWRVNAKGVLQPRALKTEEYSQEAPRDALVHRGATETLLFSPRHDAASWAKARWISIRSPGPHNLPRRTHIITDRQCAAHTWTMTAGLTTRAHTTLRDATHPLHIEERAIEHGADALVWCPRPKDAGTLRLTIPTLGRLPLRTRDGSFLGPPILGAAPVTASGLSAREAGAIVQGVASVAAGDAHLGAFLVEQALATMTRRTGNEQLVMHLMQMLGAGGVAEAALRAGWASTGRAWNREEDPHHALGTIAALGALGRSRERMLAEARLGKIATRFGREREPMSAWIRWREVTHQIDNGSLSTTDSVQQLESAFQHDRQELWMLATRASLWLANEDAAPSKRERTFLAAAFQKNKLPLAWKLLTNTLPALPCVDSACALDAYGQRLGHLQKKLRQTPDAWPQLLAVFRAQSLGQRHHPARVDAKRETPTIGGLFFTLANAQQIDAGDHPALARLLTDMAGPVLARYEGNRALCNPGNVDLMRALGLELRESLRLRGVTAPSAETRAIIWFGARGFPAACSSPQMYLREAATFRKEAPEQAPLLLSTLQGWMGGMQLNRMQRRALLDQAAQFATSSTRGDQCALWNLAMSATLLSEDAMAQAQAKLLRALNCTRETGSAFSVDAEVLGAFLHYERTSALRADLSPEAQRRFTAARKHPHFAASCPAFGVQRPHLRDLLSPALRSLVVTPHRAATARGDTSIRLATATRQLADADRLFTQASAALRRGDLDTALAHLKSAGALYQRAGDPSRAAQVKHVQGTLAALSSAQPADDANKKRGTTRQRQKIDPDAPLARIKKGDARAVLTALRGNTSRSAADRALLLALSLLLEQPAQTAALLTQHPNVGGTTCKPTTP